jgi:hypothetical protein
MLRQWSAQATPLCILIRNKSFNNASGKIKDELSLCIPALRGLHG